jgi:Glycosyltransferase (GlcNAc)
MTLFVSIASYRDPELIPTIEDCFAKAYWPGELRFGICWQHDEHEPSPPARLGKSVMRVLDVPWQHSKGACWARSRIQRELFDGEDFFLQIDSHHRFVQDWDRLLLEQIMGPTMPNKPVLSTYVAAYDLDKPLPATEQPCMMRLDKIEDTGVVLFQAFPVHWAAGKPPVKARFISAHFLFAPGHFAVEVPYDPDLYFTGEEMSMAVRAYTHGYDLFHPSVHVLWHEYTRKARTKHWDDHLDKNGIHIQWWMRDASSKKRVLDLLSGKDIGPLGFGTVRNLRDYEAYSGLDFVNWTASADAFKGDPPL